MSYDLKLCDWGMEPTKWTMRKLDLGKDFEKENEVDMGTYRGRAFPAEGAFSTKILRPKQGGH